MEPQLESIMNRLMADYRRISTLIYLERYRDMGHGRCNICLKDFKPHERVKRFPRECDHLFHIRCLEIWMKIEASCPICNRDYLGPEYANPSVIPSDPHYKDPEAYSDFANYLTSQAPSKVCVHQQEETFIKGPCGYGCYDLSPAMLEYQRQFNEKKNSQNPF